MYNLPKRNIGGLLKGALQELIHVMIKIQRSTRHNDLEKG